MGAPIEETTIINRASVETNEIIDGIMYINGVPQTINNDQKKAS